LDEDRDERDEREVLREAAGRRLFLSLFDAVGRDEDCLFASVGGGESATRRDVLLFVELVALADTGGVDERLASGLGLLYRNVGDLSRSLSAAALAVCLLLVVCLLLAFGDFGDWTDFFASLI
jgi:hypothetical protein